MTKLSWHGYAIVATSIAFLTVPPAIKGDTAEREAQRIFRALTSLDLPESDTRMVTMVSLVSQGDKAAAARIATADKNFYDITLRNMISPWSSSSGSLLNRFDDMQALAVGLTRDRVDFRQFLTGSQLYQGRSGIGLPAYRDNGNEHFAEIEAAALDPTTTLVQTLRPDRRSIGAFGTRAFASAYYEAGTNRRAVKFAIEHFLCKPITAWRELNLPDRFVRRDVSRTPAGSVRGYHQECRGCHAAMDAFSGAFAFSDYSGGRFTSLTSVSPKYALHADVYPEGFVVTDGRWKNLLAQHQNAVFEWRGPTEGSTLEEFASMLANSRAFSECMSEHVTKQVCRNPSTRTLVTELASAFENNRYDLRSLFEKAVLHPQCQGD